jgi:RNA polymerase sigma factor (sigma-70 family)
MQPPGSSDALQHWLTRLQEGDPAARNELIRHAQQSLRRLTVRMLRHYPVVRDWEETSDVFQNVLARLARALLTAQVPTAEALFSLASTLIRCELIDLTRHILGPEGPATHRLPSGHPGAEALSPEANSSHDPYRLALWADLHRAIAALPDEERCLFDLIYYQGRSLPEAATLLGAPERTLRRTWQAVRLRFLERFGDDLPF